MAISRHCSCKVIRLQELSNDTIKSALVGISALETSGDGEGTLASKIGNAIRRDLGKADPLVRYFAVQVLEETAADRRTDASDFTYGTPVFYHTGAEGEVARRPTPCFVVDSKEICEANEGELNVSTKLKGAATWPVPVENLESRTDEFPEDVRESSSSGAENGNGEEDADEEEEDGDYEDDGAKRKAVKTKERKPKKKKRKKNVKREKGHRFEDKLGAISNSFNGFTTSVDAECKEITFVQVDKHIDVMNVLSGVQLLTFQLEAMARDNKRLQKEFNASEKRRKAVIAKKARLEADLEKVRQEESELDSVLTKHVVTQQLYLTKTANLQQSQQSMGEAPFIEWCIDVTAELLCCHWTLLPFSNQFELTPNGQYSV